MFGGPDVQVVNVTKDAIWTREAALPDGAAIAPMDPRWLLPKGVRMPDKVPFPQPKLLREAQQEQFLRDMEIDPHKYYPADTDREQFKVWPDEGMILEPRKMLKARGIELDDDE